MDIELINGVFFQHLNPIVTTGGRVMHAIKGTDYHLPKFGECYFSTCLPKDPKAWKKHSKMICNLFVPSGTLKFVFYDDRSESKDFKRIVEFEVSEKNYGRLIIHPGIWFGFANVGQSGESFILNVASIAHDPSESIRLEPWATEIPYTWKFD